jgi:hypothetical protein
MFIYLNGNLEGLIQPIDSILNQKNPFSIFIFCVFKSQLIIAWGDYFIWQLSVATSCKVV